MKNNLFLLLTLLATPLTACLPSQSEQLSDSKTNSRQPEVSQQRFDNLSLPFALKDIDPDHGILNPLGIVRFQADQGNIGHSGIDFPLYQESPIYAVADGEIVNIKSSSDPWEGMSVIHIIQKTASGEGWGFSYEHITPREKLAPDTRVSQGEFIGTKTAPEGFTAHFQLSYHFNNYQYTRDPQCWPDFLEEKTHQQLTTWWKKYSQTDYFLTGWQTTHNENAYPFKGLLDAQNYPQGPQFCYPLGTDARSPT